MNHPSVKLGKLLKESREGRGLTLFEIAQSTNTTAQYVCDVEHGRKRMTYELIKPWSAAIRVDPVIILSFILSEKQYEAERRSGIKLDFKYVPKGQNSTKVPASQESRP